MLTAPILLVVLAAAALYALLSRRIEASVLTLPMIFTGLGLALGRLGLDLVPMATGSGAIHGITEITEITLILVLFSDASGVRRQTLAGNVAIPARLLLIGMPLTVALGALVARAVSPDQPWTLAFLLAAILTPTDAALGQSVVTNPRVPKRISQSINIESGLNDGLALPIVLVAAIIASRAAGQGPEEAQPGMAYFALRQVTLGPLAGILVGYAAARLLDVAVRLKAATTVAQGLYFLCVAFIAYLGAELIGGNGFIAAFTGGLVFGNTLRAPSMFIREFMEGEGQLLTLLTFLVFGAVLAPVGIAHASWKTVTLAALFLTVVRIVPVWLSLPGLKMSGYEKLFLGWFGPRGLASILFALLVLERFPIPGSEEVTACVVLTVIASIVLHGVTATPMANRFNPSGDKKPARQHGDPRRP